MTTRGDRLNEQLTEATIKRDESLRELGQLTEYENNKPLQLAEEKTRYKQQQYQHSIQLAAQEANLQKQQYELTSLVSQLQDTEKLLGELVEVRCRRLHNYSFAQREKFGEVNFILRMRTELVPKIPRKRKAPVEAGSGHCT
jgi:hypothetical protein